MPTFSWEDEFMREYKALSYEQRALFREARKVFVRVFKEFEATGQAGIPKFPKRLGVTHMAGRPGILEFAWNKDGRCTWQYGVSPRSGMFHVHWRHIGTHAIYSQP
jgi:hypothetical protein